MEPVWPADWSAVNWVAFGGALVGVFWAYHGWMNIAPVAEEVKNPKRNIPLALLTGVFVIIALYVSVNLAYYLIIPSQEIAALKDRTVAGEFAVRVLGPAGLLVASAAIMTSVFGSLNGNLLVGPRLLFAMGQDGLAPRGLSRLHPRYATPAAATAVLAGWCILLVFVVAVLTTWRLPVLSLGGGSLDLNLPAGKAPFDVITDFAMFGAISFETLAVASIFVFRRRYPVGSIELPYRCPLYPFLPAVYVLALGTILVNMFWSQRVEAMTGVGFILVGAIVYRLIARRG
jgi:amino acid transporter